MKQFTPIVRTKGRSGVHKGQGELSHMKKVCAFASVLAVLGGCQGPSHAPTNAKPTPAQQEQAAETYKTPQGVEYEITRFGHFSPVQLPQNSDLKMAGGDLAKYAGTACTLDVPPDTAPVRCDLYVQPDRDGTLIGYAALTQFPNGVSFNTDTTTNPQKEPRGKACGLSGKIYDSNGSRRAVTDASQDFDGSVMYSAWEKNPGEFLVSQVGPNDQGETGNDGALGVWYLSKKGDKLRISQERWNYCYSDKDVNVDDVFYIAVSLVRK
jgi:hypothetical protein